MRLKPLCLSILTLGYFALPNHQALAQNNLSHSKPLEAAAPRAATHLLEPSHNINHNLDSAEDLNIAESALRELNKTGIILQDAWSQDTLNQLLNAIFNQTNLPKPVALLIIKDQNINAFAVPGGLIAINTGLIKQAKNMDELAGVLSHETAHLSQRHYHRSTEDNKGNTLIQLGGLVAAILLARQDPDSANAVAIGSQAYVVDKQLAFSRDYEREADRIGMQTMEDTGFNPKSMATFFDTLQKESRQVGQVPAYLQTHPLPEERLSNAYLRASQLSKPPSLLKRNTALNQEDSFHYLQLRLAVLTKQVTIVSLETPAKTDDAAALALATAYIQTRDVGNISKALVLAKRVLDKHPDMPLAAITLSEVELANNNAKQALATLMPLFNQLPDNRALTLSIAKAYTANGQASTTIALLQPISRNNVHDINTWQLLADAATSLPTENPDRAQLMLRYRAEVDFWQDNISRAIAQLTQAKTLATSFITQAQIEKRLVEMKESERNAVK